MLESIEATREIAELTGLEHRVYLPLTSEGEKKPLILLVHGRAGDMRVMWTFTKLLEDIKPLVISVQAPVRDLELDGWSWWSVERDTSGASRRASLEEIENAINLLHRFLERLSEAYSFDRRKVIGIGFSQGAALISSLSLYFPDNFLAVANLAGFLPTVVREGRKSSWPEICEKLPSYFISHGLKDQIIPIDRARSAAEYLRNLSAEVTFHEDDTGHKVGAPGMKALGQWINQHV